MRDTIYCTNQTKKTEGNGAHRDWEGPPLAASGRGEMQIPTAQYVEGSMCQEARNDTSSECSDQRERGYIVSMPAPRSSAVSFSLQQ
jgi:hypothetical protein